MSVPNMERPGPAQIESSREEKQHNGKDKPPHAIAEAYNGIKREPRTARVGNRVKHGKIKIHCRSNGVAFRFSFRSVLPAHSTGPSVITGAPGHSCWMRDPSSLCRPGPKSDRLWPECYRQKTRPKLTRPCWRAMCGAQIAAP